MSQQETALIKEIKEYISSNLQRPLSVAAICRQFQTNRTTLQEWFREYWNSSVHAFILEKRMELARSLLCDTELPVKLIALRCGYRKVHSFNKAFRRKCGFSPGQYRQDRPFVRVVVNIAESHPV